MTGLGTLVRLVLRRNRWFYLAWVLCLAVVVPRTASAYAPRTFDGAAKVQVTAQGSIRRMGRPAAGWAG